MTHSLDESAFGSPGSLAAEVSPEIENAILQLIVDGFERWKTRGFDRVGDYEDHYTIRLVACMSEIRRERNMALLPRFHHVEPSDAMLEGHEDPIHAPHIDMVVSWDIFADKAFLRIECKRLAPNDLARLYVVEGMDRFVQGYYGPQAQVGAMIGYVIDGTLDEIFARINGQVARSPGMGSSHSLVPAAPIDWLNSIFSSTHQRPAPFAVIRLTHIFFDMSGIGPPS